MSAEAPEPLLLQNNPLKDILALKSQCLHHVCTDSVHLRKQRLILSTKMGGLFFPFHLLPPANEEGTEAAKCNQPYLGELLSISDLECSLCIR